MAEYIIIGLLVLVTVLLLLLLRKQGTGLAGAIADRVTEQVTEQVADRTAEQMEEKLDRATEDIVRSVRILGDGSINAISAIGSTLTDNQRLASDLQREELEQLRAQLRQQLRDMAQSSESRMEGMRTAIDTGMEGMRASLDGGMDKLREENGRKLDEIRGTVDEKLQTTLEKRISESFRTVSEQLEQVYKGLGEMQTIASDVGSLKRVLTTVKSRGIMGEIALGAIIGDILAPEQYETNFATVPGSTERVEYAVKLPAEDGILYLPIDSKFPGDTYAKLLDAQETGDREAVAAAYKALENTIRQEARDIRTKYVSVPYTTNFGILFLPYEGLYAEVVNHGLIEKLQKEFQINVAGPSTMAALLNSLQMGFKTLAIQKRSGEVWEVLSAVKTEFDNFEEVMKKMQAHLNQTSSDLDKLMGVRTRKIQKRLQNIQKLEESAAEEVLQLSVSEYLDED